MIGPNVVPTRCFILMNPEAGLHKDTPGPEEVRATAARIGLDAQIIESKTADEMVQTIDRLRAEGARCIAVMGGDGTIHAAIQHLAGTEMVLGIIPAGTHNNFSHALGLPMELAPALKIIQAGRTAAVDIGLSKGVFFTEAAGVGVFADILREYGDANKNFWRGLRAIWKIFWSLRPRRLRLTLDGKVVSERSVMCTVANSYRIGDGATVAPGAKLNDGLFDVVIVGDLTRFQLFRYYRAVKANAHLGLSKVTQFKAKLVSIESARPMSLHIDDQIVGTTPALIEMAPRSLRVFV